MSHRFVTLRSATPINLVVVKEPEIAEVHWLDVRASTNLTGCSVLIRFGYFALPSNRPSKMGNKKDNLTHVALRQLSPHFFALAATGYRLYKRRRKVWADDVWALFAAVAVIVQVVAVLLRVTKFRGVSANVLKKKSSFLFPIVYYLTAIAFYLVVWASRLSILFSIVRIDSSAARRKLLFCAAAIFCITALLLVAQLFWVCESRTHSSWKSLPVPQCDLPPRTAIFQFIADATSNAILLFAPWPLFRSLVDKSLGRKLMIIFSVCVVTTIGCLSSIVANIPVIVTTTIDVVGHPEYRETAEFSSIFWPGTNGTLQLQTVGQQHPQDMALPAPNRTPDMSESLKSSTKAVTFRDSRALGQLLLIVWLDRRIVDSLSEIT
ncbi:hypothetical protein C8R45DRAFT_935952 [Mycena sanguinolenta]|nr:hypothetical protein C8R45DRAFT_935952 [Mycena sanguinolenta]